MCPFVVSYNVVKHSSEYRRKHYSCFVYISHTRLKAIHETELNQFLCNYSKLDF
jgi:hypothetical protein